jgi:hypothetical protein
MTADSQDYYTVNTEDGRCANTECPNRYPEGTFCLVATAEQVVGGHRRLSLWLCEPCANALLLYRNDLGIVVRMALRS